MAFPVMKTAPRGEVDFSFAFENTVFSVVPSIACIAFSVATIISLLRKTAQRQNVSFWNLVETGSVLLLAMFLLHLASIITVSKLPDSSKLRTTLALAACSLRLVAAFGIFAVYLLLRHGARMGLGTYLLLTSVADGIRVHSIWVAALNEPRQGLEVSLASLQTTMIAVSIVFVVYESIASSSLTSKSARGIGFKVEEQTSSTLSVLTFGWLWYMLAFGRKNKIHDHDLQHIDYNPAATYKFDQRSKAADQSTRAGFVGGLVLRYLLSSLLTLLAAGATLAQPLIIQGVVNYLQSDQHYSVGVWLVIAMFFDQLAIAFLNAHSEQFLSQLVYRLRAFLTEKILERSFSPTAPKDGWTDTSSKAIVHLSTDLPTITQGVTISKSILSNFVIVSVGSFLLFRLIHVAFLGPLLVTLASTLVPILLGGTLARSQRLSLEATEKRVQSMKSLLSETRAVRIGRVQKIAAELAFHNRRVEIDATCAFRRIVTVVVVTATSVNGLAVLAAFGGFSLMSSLTIDYSILFTALATMQIMITPLLSLVQMLPTLISSLVCVKRLKAYLGDSYPGESGETPLSQGAPLMAFNNADLGWEAEKPIVSGLSITLDPGDIISISGISSSGKSTILNAVLNEAKVMTGEMVVGAKSIAYCSQKPWFVPGLSIRESIALGNSFDQGLYDRVIQCCCLDTDLRALHHGDGATLDSTGAPLSGGQQKRVALARALYHEPDLLLMDEVFTGLDVTTRRQVAMNMFGSDGFVKQHAAMGVLMVATESPAFLSDYSNMQFLSVDAGKLTPIDNAHVAVPNQRAANDEAPPLNEEIATTDAATVGAFELSDEKQVSAVHQALHDEVAVTEEVAGRTPSPYRTYFKSFGSPLSLSIILGTALAYIAIDRASSFWLSQWTSTYSNSLLGTNDGYYIGVYACFVVGSIVTSFCCVWVYFMKAIPDSGWALHSTMLETLLKTPALNVEQTKSEIINRFTQDIDAVDLALPQALQNLVFAVGSGIASIVVIGIGSPYTLVLVVVLLPIIYILQKHYVATSAQLRKLQVAAQAPILSTVSAAVDGRLTLRAMQKQSYMADTLSERVYSGLRPGYLFASVQRWMLLVLNLANASVITALAALLVGLRGHGNIAWAGLALLNAVTLSQDAILLMTWWTSFENHMASMERILEYTTTTPAEMAETPETRPDDSWPAEGKIELRDLSLSYSNHEVVRGINIEIVPGTKAAVIGRTGSGKTSLTQALFNLIDVSSGGVFVDGIKLSTVDCDTVRERIVGHTQFIFSNGTTTVRKNIDPFNTRTDEEIHVALSRVAAEPSMADDVVSRLDSTWDECNFSAGWQQRIGLARTVLRKSNVYILDEPTSGMDEECHSWVMNALFDTLADRTMFVVTHSLLGIEKFDVVLVMSDGELVESGPPSELLADSSTRLSEFAKTL